MASKKAVVDWEKIDNMLTLIQDSSTPGQPINNQNQDEVPTVFLDTKTLKGTEATLTVKIVLTKTVPMWKVGFHYSLTPYLAENQKFICCNETTDASGEMCIPCEFMQSKRFQKLRALAWTIKENKQNVLDSYDTATREFLQKEAKDILNFRSTVFYYVTFVKVPYDGSLYIFRTFEQEAMKVLQAIVKNKEKGNALFEWKKGYNLVLNFKRSAKSQYMNIDSVEFSDETAPLTKDKDVVKKLETFLKKFDIFRRLKVDEVDIEAQKALTKKWLQLKETGLQRCGYIWNRDDENYVHQAPVQSEPQVKEAIEDTKDFNIDEVLSELDELDI